MSGGADKPRGSAQVDERTGAMASSRPPAPSHAGPARFASWVWGVVAAESDGDIVGSRAKELS